MLNGMTSPTACTWFSQVLAGSDTSMQSTNDGIDACGFSFSRNVRFRCSFCTFLIRQGFSARTKMNQENVRVQLKAALNTRVKIKGYLCEIFSL
jgi:hypothetical protein